MAPPLTPGKLSVPPHHRHAIRRLRTERLLSAGTERKLVLVTAPAGYGKTTLVAGWLPSSAARTAWVSLEPADDDPARFWSYVSAALVRSGATVHGTEDEPRPLTALTADLTHLDRDLVLVLDDYHVITDADIHHDLASLIDQHVPQLHIVLISRTDPPFLKARWKANAEVTEIRARQLAFSPDEAELFLDDQGVTLSSSIRATLFDKVNGWPAALRLVALWVTGHDDPATAVTRFASSDVTIADYLATEVLNDLPDSTRQFLLTTSILPWLTGPLCDALTGRTDGSATLRELSRRDLFVQPLDEREDSYRYHGLFAELLRNELRAANPEELAGLHQRAARWFAAHRFAEESINQAIAARDWPTVRTAILAEVLEIGRRYPPTVVEGWLRSLPAEVRENDPLFLLLHGYVLATLGRITDGRRALDSVLSDSDRPSGAPDPDLPELVAIAYGIRAGIARLECDLAETTRCAHQVTIELQDLTNPSSALANMARAIADTARAGALFWGGDLASSETLLRDTEHAAVDHGLIRMRINAMSCHALLLATTGRLAEGQTLAAESLSLAREFGISEFFQANTAHLAEAIVTLHHGELAGALRLLAAITGRARRHGDRGVLLTTAVLTARLLGACEDYTAAVATLTQAQATWPGWQPPPALQASLLAEEVRLRIRAGDLAAAHVLENRLLALPDAAPVISLAKQSATARLRVADGDTESALSLLATVVNNATAENLPVTAIEGLIDATQAANATGQTNVALQYLERALRLARHDEIIGPFVWELKSLQPLLAMLPTRAGDVDGGNFRTRLLDRLEHGTVTGQQRRANPAHTETLSDRERTVLRLLSSSLSNTEIAAALSISPNTLKSHIKNIHRKLGTTNRQQTRAKARHLALARGTP